MTLSQVVELLLSRGSAQSSSVTLTRNAKGDTQIEVTVRTDPEIGIHGPAEASAAAATVYDRLRELYPFGQAPVPDGGQS